MLYEKPDSEPWEGVLQVPNFFCCLLILYPVKKLLKINPLSSFAKPFLAFCFHSSLLSQPPSHFKSTTSIQFKRYRILLGVSLHI